jgi:superoxide dismutase, Cu-Zn family
MKTFICTIVVCAFQCLVHAQQDTTTQGQSEAASGSPVTASEQTQQPTMATAKLEPKSGSKVTGFVSFVTVGDQVRVAGVIQNLTPGKHGLHIHDKGDCSASDAASAGPHFNPTQQHHGGPMTAEHHAGDLGNIEADASGKAVLSLETKLDLTGKDSIIGKSVVVHEKEDDLKTDPAGNSGARIACGVIKTFEMPRLPTTNQKD